MSEKPDHGRSRFNTSFDFPQRCPVRSSSADRPGPLTALGGSRDASGNQRSQPRGQPQLRLHNLRRMHYLLSVFHSLLWLVVSPVCHLVTRLAFVCPVCNFRSFYKKNMATHLESKFHRDHFGFLSEHLTGPVVDFLQVPTLLTGKTKRPAFQQIRKDNFLGWRLA